MRNVGLGVSDFEVQGLELWMLKFRLRVRALDLGSGVDTAQSVNCPNWDLLRKGCQKEW